MLSGESTPLLKESVELRPGSEPLDIDGVDRNSVLFGGTKVLQATGIDIKEKLAGTWLSRSPKLSLADSHP
jgi:manganese-transporting P-type ATPase